MDFFNYAGLAGYLLDIRFEIVLAISDEAKRERHPPSRRIAKGSLETHDQAIVSACERANAAGEAVGTELSAFVAAAKHRLCSFRHSRPGQYYSAMSAFGLTEAQQRRLDRDDCPSCGGLCIPDNRCDCTFEERRAARERDMARAQKRRSASDK